MFYRLYSARKIAENLRDLPNGQISTFHVDTITLKKAFSSRLIRQAVLLKFPKNFEFTRSSTSSDIITSGPSAFKKGYRIIFAVEAQKMTDLFGDIDDTCQYICSYYRREYEKGEV